MEFVPSLTCFGSKTTAERTTSKLGISGSWSRNSGGKNFPLFSLVCPQAELLEPLEEGTSLAVLLGVCSSSHRSLWAGEKQERSLGEEKAVPGFLLPWHFLKTSWLLWELQTSQNCSGT